jgi:hypothetical protein
MDALAVTGLIVHPNHLFYGVLKKIMPSLLAQSGAIRTAVENGNESPEALDGIWGALSDRMSVVALESIVMAGNQTFRKVGLTP